MGPASARSPSFLGWKLMGIDNPLVGGSNPPAATIYIKGLRGAAVTGAKPAGSRLKGCRGKDGAKPRGE